MFKVYAFNKYGKNIGCVFESDSYRECEEFIRDTLEVAGDVDLRIEPEIDYDMEV